jgi:hypothetical protein
MPQLLFTTTAPVQTWSRNARIKSVILPSLRTDLEHRYCSEEQFTLSNYCYFETNVLSGNKAKLSSTGKTTKNGIGVDKVKDDSFVASKYILLVLITQRYMKAQVIPNFKRVHISHYTQ